MKLATRSRAAIPPPSPYPAPGLPPKVNPPQPKPRTVTRTVSPPPAPDVQPRNSGRFAAFPPRSAAEEAVADAVKEGRRLIEFRHVVDALSGFPGGGVVLDVLRGRLLFGDNPIVRVKVKRSPMADAMGLGASVQKRLRVDSVVVR